MWIVPSTKGEKAENSTPISPPHTSPHRALFLPELLLYYFEYLTTSELAVATRVCRDWSAALDLVWRRHEVPLSAVLDVLDMVSLRFDSMAHWGICFAPLLTTQNGALQLSDIPPANPPMYAVERGTLFFEEYAQWITELEIEGDLDSSVDDLLGDICTNLERPLFPNLKSLRVSAAGAILDYRYLS